MALAGTGLVAGVALAAPRSHAGTGGRAKQAAALDDANLRLAATAIESEALQSGALKHPLSGREPAAVLLLSDNALLRAALRADPSRHVVGTTAVMGAPPYQLAHELARRPGHAHITRTRTLQRFTHAVPVSGSAGVGHSGRTAHGRPAPFRKADGVYVDPRLPHPSRPTIATVAIRSALKKLGQPYVWAADGPTTFDCSGLTRWSYAHAGVGLTHFTGDQWNEGRLIPPHDALPGDLVLFGDPIFHVGMYLGAGWMVNAPFTGHYVDVVPVPSGAAGVVRP
jgi:cell wall-associated NlpC family hydrolase